MTSTVGARETDGQRVLSQVFFTLGQTDKKKIKPNKSTFFLSFYFNQPKKRNDQEKKEGGRNLGNKG